ncbi:glycosyltransferase family 2 protein [Sulfoacidibacillus thermotolerans]|uniref:Glycosyltransferase 2-like domain-containing protein n=1 Tax=Sulfoacidibacillus thermotolerans TaxID=1765684 RepID=A0A2U3D871_SULT2|nr:glycosyltransferase family 2 protein [Sulfoacidibacillus thermotolerans]PWI57461.1 hypothetical protein BM613_08275 [Sulfoacidibacillus thermotolerans]
MNDFVNLIVVSYNTQKQTRQCLENLLRFTEVPHHIWVIDNGSTDGSKEMLHTLQQQTNAHFTLLENEVNKGYSRAVNQVYGNLDRHGDICYVNSDVYVGPEWAVRFQYHLAHDEQIAAVAPIGRGIGGKQDAANYGAFACTNAYDEQSLLAFNRRRSAAVPSAVTTKSLQGTLLYIRRAAHEQIGGLDPGCECGADDADWCLRARLLGWKLIVALDTWVWHDDHRSFLQLPDRGIRVVDRSWRYFNQKWSGKFNNLSWADLMENSLPSDYPFYQYEEFYTSKSAP